MSRFSVIITSYNRLEKLKRATNSALNQTYKDFEIIVVDDCSIDGSREYLKELDNPKINCYYFSENKGQAIATNYAVKKANNKWLAFLDADDYWRSNKLEVFDKEIEKVSSQNKVFYSSSYMVNTKGEILRKNKATTSGSIFREEKLFNPIGGQSRVVVDRDAYLEVDGLDEKLPASKDWDLWIRLTKKYKVKSIPEVLTFYEENNESISSNLNKVLEGRKKFWEKHYPEGMTDYEKYICYNHLGRFLLNRGFRRQARKYFWNAWQFKIGNLKSLIYFLTSYFPLSIVRTTYKIQNKYL